VGPPGGPKKRGINIILKKKLTKKNKNKRNNFLTVIISF
jgi:hypothetical protein